MGQSQSNLYMRYVEDIQEGLTKAYNPYEILGVRQRCTEEEVKNAFRKTALMAHPDRGGTQHMFDLVKEAFKKVCEDLKNEHRREDLPYEFRQNTETNQLPNFLPDITPEQALEMRSRFNQTFQETFVPSTINKFGYGDFLEKDVELDYDPDENVPKTTEGFKKAFESQRTKYARKIVVDHDPLPTDIRSSHIQPIELGTVVPSDMSVNVGGRVASDLVVAYDSRYLVDNLKEETDKKLTMKDAERIVKKRNEDKKLTPEEKEKTLRTENMRIEHQKNILKSEEQEAERMKKLNDIVMRKLLTSQ